MVSGLLSAAGSVGGGIEGVITLEADAPSREGSSVESTPGRRMESRTTRE
jgi:hypothetical protein